MEQDKKASRLQRFIGNDATQRKSIACNFLMPTEEVKKHLSEYAKSVQEAVGKNKSPKK